MSAPTLLLLASGDNHPETAHSAEGFLETLRAARPNLDIRLAHAAHRLPSVAQTVNRLARAGVREVIVAGLDLINQSSPVREALCVAQRLAAGHPDLRIIAAQDVGPDPSLLGVVDSRLREALSRARVGELDGLVLSTGALGDTRTQSRIARCVRQWSHHHHLPVLHSAAEGSGGVPAAAAVRSLRAQGRRHVAVGSWFLTADAMWRDERDAALAAGAIAVADPLGAAEESIRAVLARYAFAAMDLLDGASSAPVEQDPMPTRHLSAVSA